MARLFVAAWPPPQVMQVLEAIPRPRLAGVRWSLPEQWHVTLRFLGDADVDESRRALDTVEHGPAEAVMGTAARSLGRDALVVDIAGLDTLAREVRRAFETGAHEAAAAPFVGHLTLARRRQGSPRSVLQGPTSTSWTVGEITLVQSELHPDGARYTVVGRRRLVAPAGSDDLAVRRPSAPNG